MRGHQDTIILRAVGWFAGQGKELLGLKGCTTYSQCTSALHSIIQTPDSRRGSK